ncbi:hypothetical protein BJ085DRAFT_39381 [Dimargaris cristalligena]|uniref:VHS domain-containing protein n=1 Tax=Dimargaris cristalligena TaxID=215637 RepID=A0A4P9ZLP6_9FUNG|nr:hypothetical protein BJ085DRAFT_39381 [Dimargaris cristalligena]|eukprot:RKP34234.1 hypothetical protein BJ085DRAFT_39381 [Dimargaris cristalligena]
MATQSETIIEPPPRTLSTKRSRWNLVLGLLKGKPEVSVDRAIEHPLEGLPDLIAEVKASDKFWKKTAGNLRRRLWSRKVTASIGSLMVLNSLVEEAPTTVLPTIAAPTFLNDLTNRIYSATTIHVLRDALINILEHWAAQTSDPALTTPLAHTALGAQRYWGPPRIRFVPRPLVSGVSEHYGVFGYTMLAPLGAYVEPQLPGALHLSPTAPQPATLATLALNYAQMLTEALMTISPETNDINDNPVVGEFIPKSRELHQALLSVLQHIPPGDTDLIDRIVSSTGQLADAVRMYTDLLDAHQLHLVKEESKTDPRSRQPSPLFIGRPLSAAAGPGTAASASSPPPVPLTHHPRDLHTPTIPQPPKSSPSRPPSGVPEIVVEKSTFMAPAITPAHLPPYLTPDYASCSQTSSSDSITNSPDLRGMSAKKQGKMPASRADSLNEVYDGSHL